jgi:peptidoglycan hydrolase-like protein with peptidoglycan-binding domain
MGFDKRNLALPAIVAVAAIITMNAVIGQDGKHPAPLGDKGQHQKASKSKTSVVNPKILNRKSTPAKAVVASPRSKPQSDSVEVNEDAIGQLLRAADGDTKKPLQTSNNTPEAKKIRFVQTRLAQLGFAPGPADGVLGQKTRDAIKKFEYSRKIPVTGKISRSLVKALSQSASFATVKLT